VRRARSTVTSLAIASLFAAALASTATAGTGSTCIGNQGADGEQGAGFSRFLGVFVPFGACRTGADVVGPLVTDYRFALEFPLTSLPADATITGATLAIRTSQPDGANQTAIHGYAGDGSITSGDVEVTGSSVLHTPTTSAREDVDVTTLLTPDVVTAGWVGFSVRQEPMVPFESALWDCPNEDLYPILTIEYSLPDPPAPTPTPTATAAAAPTATPTASPTPAATSLPNTAAASGGTWAAVSLALITVVGIVVLLAARRPRPTR
jgi:hypothetical protein